MSSKREKIVAAFSQQKSNFLVRHYPGPWAEMITSRIIVSVPSYSIRKLDRPDEVMKIWDKIIELEDELIGWEGKYS